MEYIVKYRDFLLAENQRQNLISRKTAAEEFPKHVLDSQEVLKYEKWENLQVADMGSGAGFPGLILAMHCPSSQFTLLESDQKKSAFLEQAAQHLGLVNVNVVSRRLEELGQDEGFRERFDVVTARALAAMNILLEYGMPLLKRGGSAWFWKGIQAEEEIKQAHSALTVLQARVEQIYWYKLMEERDRALIKVVKDGPTPAKYPRRVGVPSKRPL